MRRTELKRGKPLQRGRVLARNPRRRRASFRLPGATGWTQRVFTLYGRVCVACGGRATTAHHVVPRQAILGDTRKPFEERRRLAYDARNGCPACWPCHDAHEVASRRFLFRELPGGAVAWAVEHGFSRRVMDRRLYP